MLSVVIPAFNEESIIDDCHREVVAVMDELGMPFEIIYVDDGSTDGTRSKLREMSRADDRASAVLLSRNFGKEIALTAGLDHASGEAIIILDADLQDPPELIPDLVKIWQDTGADNIYGQRTGRDGESYTKKTTASLFYRLMSSLGDVELPKDAGDFRLLSRRAVDAVCSQRERHRFMKGLFAWVGFKSIAMPYERKARIGGDTGWSYPRLIGLAVDGITSFSIAPLRLIGIMGFAIALLAVAGIVFYVTKAIFYGEDVAGFPTLMVSILFLGGVQLISLGIIGEYLGRIFNESKDRDLYLIDEVCGSKKE